MKIVVLKESPPTLQLEFDPKEVEHELFQTAQAETSKTEKIEVMSEDIKPYDTTALDTAMTEVAKEKPVLEKIKVEEIDEPPISTTIITGEPVKDEPPINTLGKMVDSIREKYCGDVQFEYEEVEIEPAKVDKEGNIITEAVTEIQVIEKDMKKIPQFQIGRMETLAAYQTVKEESEKLQAEAEREEEPFEPVKPVEEEPVEEPKKEEPVKPTEEELIIEELREIRR